MSGVVVVADHVVSHTARPLERQRLPDWVRASTVTSRSAERLASVRQRPLWEAARPWVRAFRLPLRG
jgi:hypothetical protein